MAQLDRFAPIYVPQWLRPTNTSLEQFRPMPREPPINFWIYSASLFPGPLLHKLLDKDQERARRCIEEHQKSVSSTPSSSVSHSSINSNSPGVPPIPPTLATIPSAPPNLFLNLAPLSPSTYAVRWLSLQSEEQKSRAQTALSASLYNTPLSISDTPLPLPLFILEAPSIRENHPQIALGDSVFLRQLRPWNKSFQGILFEAFIWNIERRLGKIELRCDALGVPPMWESGHFNVEWSPQVRPFHAINQALEFVGMELLEGSEGCCARKWLFPEEEDVVKFEDADPRKAPDLIVHTEWVDKDLNVEQKLAAVSIVHGTHQIPYLISGPPGTGKTKTLVETTLQILSNHPSTHVLLCGASNSSADTLVRRLGMHLMPGNLFRLNDPSRPIDEVRSDVRLFCFTSEDGQRWALPPLKDLLSKKVIVTSCIDASLLFLARCTNSGLSTFSSHIFSHLYPTLPTAQSLSETPHFGFLLIDEAAQASEPEICIPLSVVMPTPTGYRPTVVICGDQNQLGPKIENADCRKQNMDISLLERLFERDVYKKHPLARENLKKMRKTKKKLLSGSANGVLPFEVVGGLETPFCNLNKNYRSHPVILMVPSTLFYNDTLTPSAPSSILHTPLTHWSPLPPSFPLLFLSPPPSAQENWVDEGASWFNMGEVHLVESVVCALLNKEPRERKLDETEWDLFGKQRFGIGNGDISVITPFREQVWKIRFALRKIGLGDVDVGDVESLQGAENRIIIISTVRSSPRYLKEDQQLNRGLMFERKRFNVAITRAKELLIIIGNPFILATDPWWRPLLEFTLRHKAYRGPPIPSNIIDPYSSANISELEEEWVRRGGKFSVLNGGGGGDGNGEEKEEEEGMVVAGSVVRETFREED